MPAETERTEHGACAQEVAGSGCGGQSEWLEKRGCYDMLGYPSWGIPEATEAQRLDLVFLWSFHIPLGHGLWHGGQRHSLLIEGPGKTLLLSLLQSCEMPFLRPWVAQ